MSNLWVNTEDLGDFSESEYAYDAVKTASYLLWGLSGRKFSGTTTVTERYVSTLEPLLSSNSSVAATPVLINGRVENIAGSRGSNARQDLMGDGSSSSRRVRLRGRKVIEVHHLRDIYGEIIDPSTYYMGEHSTIYGTPNAKWTSASIEVTYTYGSPPPAAGRAAARVLATELVKLFENDDTCALPQRVTSVARQGVSYTVLDNQDFIDELKTGIYAVDLFLRVANPDKARARSRVFSPDTPRARRITGKSPAFQLSALDLYFNQEGGTNIYYTNELGADFLADDSAWVLSAVFSNWANTITKTFANAAIYDSVEGTIRLNASYANLLSVLGPRDPGTIDLYATRPSLGNPAVDEIINILTSNIIYQLGDRSKPIAIA